MDAGRFEEKATFLALVPPLLHCDWRAGFMVYRRRAVIWFIFRKIHHKGFNAVQFMLYSPETQITAGPWQEAGGITKKAGPMRQEARPLRQVAQRRRRGQ